MTRAVVRALTTILLVGAIFAATRGLVRALPGDPLETLLAESGTSLPIETVRSELRLDRPFGKALLEDSRALVHGDFGTSLLSKKPIAPLLWSRFAKTAELTGVTAILALALSLLIGLSSALRPDGITDRACTAYGALSAALPLPWFGPFLIVAFAVWIPLFPVGGHVLLPSIALALSLSGLWARLIRERVRETLGSQSSTAARARGIPELQILLKYGLVPCSGALVAYFGTQLGTLLAGSFVAEVIFDWKGLGTLLIDAVLKRDYPVIEAATFVAAASALLGTLLGDWCQRLIDPRISESSR